MDERRQLRVSEAISEELKELIGFEMEDPRLSVVEVTEAHVSSDGRYAHVKVNIRGEAREQKDALAALEHAKNFIRRELATRLLLRLVPELQFELDRNADADSRIDFLLRRAKRTRGEK